LGKAYTYLRRYLLHFVAMWAAGSTLGVLNTQWLVR